MSVNVLCLTLKVKHIGIYFIIKTYRHGMSNDIIVLTNCNSHVSIMSIWYYHLEYLPIATVMFKIPKHNLRLPGKNISSRYSHPIGLLSTDRFESEARSRFERNRKSPPPQNVPQTKQCLTSLSEKSASQTSVFLASITNNFRLLRYEYDNLWFG